MTLEKENCLFARVLVDVDFTNALPKRVLVKRKQLNFFVDVSCEKLPHFCMNCNCIGHSMEVYRREGGARIKSENFEGLGANGNRYKGRGVNIAG